MRRVLSLALAGWVLVACSPGAAPISQSPHDPSNPSAAEGVSPLMVASASATATPAGASGAAGHDHAHHAGHEASAHESHGDAAAPSVTYVCPMHPEVTSSTPGQCPKCNMNLVPKK